MTGDPDNSLTTWTSTTSNNVNGTYTYCPEQYRWVHTTPWTSTPNSNRGVITAEEINKLVETKKENEVEANACICEVCGTTMKVDEANKINIVKRVVLKKIDENLVDADGKPVEEDVKKTDEISKIVCVDCLAKIEALL